MQSHNKNAERELQEKDNEISAQKQKHKELLAVIDKCKIHFAQSLEAERKLKVANHKALRLESMERNILPGVYDVNMCDSGSTLNLSLLTTDTTWTNFTTVCKSWPCNSTAFSHNS